MCSLQTNEWSPKYHEFYWPANQYFLLLDIQGYVCIYDMVIAFIVMSILNVTRRIKNEICSNVKMYLHVKLTRWFWYSVIIPTQYVYTYLS